jgi:uncharacterized phage protein (TIGR02220 family)
MSLFVRVNTSFYTHIKTMKLRARIGDAAFWVPPRIWSVAAEQRPNGNFDGITSEELSLLIGYSGDANSMLQALLQAGFMDAEPLRIHNWDKHNGYHVTYSERARSAAKARWEKQTTNKGDREEKRREETSNAQALLQASPVNCSEGTGEAIKSQVKTSQELRAKAQVVLTFLNEKALRSFELVESNLKFIRARMEETHGDMDGIKQMICRQVAMWRGTDMEEYLRPSTLFNSEKFRSYYDDRSRPVNRNGSSAAKNGHARNGAHQTILPGTGSY